MATTSSTGSFTFPALRLKKANIKLLNFDRICFQFLVTKGKECRLIGYKMKENREFKKATELVELEVDPEPTKKPLSINGKVLFVQLELTAEQIRLAKELTKDDGNPYIKVVPVKKEIRGYYYVVYILSAAGTADGIEAAPCPPAIPPGG